MTNTMMRLPYRLPDFTRYSWVSEEARSVWEPRIQQTLNCWTEIEWKSVAEGLRACTLSIASPEELLNQAPLMAKFGLTVLPLGMQGVSAQPYSNSETTYQPGTQFVYRVVISSPNNAAEFHDAYQKGNQDAVGRLLGYPACCRDFFQRVWVEEQHIDTTWSMAVNTRTVQRDDTVCQVAGDSRANILLRWLGIRAVPHLPCAFDCASTVEQANRYLDFGRQLGFETEMGWLEEMLSWPVEWSALHGIAEIKTPVVKIASCTDAAARKYVVQRTGANYPDKGAQGLVFPYQQPVRRNITDSEGFKRGFEHCLTTSPINDADKPDWYFKDNSFSSLQAMEYCHQPILELARLALDEKPATVLDLGCGNGALLKKIYNKDSKVVPFGIDINASSIAHAHILFPAYTENFVTGNIFEQNSLWTGRSYSLVIFMPGRLLEVHPKQKKFLLCQLQSFSEKLLIYAYDDWLARYGGLASLAEQAGLKLLNNTPDLKTGIAVINEILDH